MGRLEPLEEAVHRTRLLGRGLATVIVLVLFVTTLAGVAAATTLDPKDVGIDNFVDSAVVDETNRWFIADGVEGDRLVILDLEGDFVTEMTGLGGIQQLNHDPDRGVVWGSMNTTNKVVAFDETTGATVKTYALPGHCPAGVAATLDILAVGSTCGAGLARINLVDDTIQFIGELDFDGPIESIDTQPRRIVALDGDTVVVVGFSGPDWEKFAEKTIPGAHDITISPNGAKIAVAANGGVQVVGFPNLLDKETFNVGGAFAIQYAPDGSLVAVDADAMLLAFKPNSPDPFWVYDLGDVEPILGSLEIGSDGAVYLLVDAPPPSGGGGGGGGGGSGGDGGGSTPGGGSPPIVGVDPGSVEGTVNYPTGMALPAGTSLMASLYDDDWDLLGTTTAGLDYTYSFAPVNPGSYRVVFSAVDDGSASGFFPEIHSGKPVLQSDTANAVVVTAGKAASTGEAILRPFYLDMFSSVFAGDIYWLGNSGITKGCNPPDNTLFCGSSGVTRGQMAAFLNRAFQLPAYTGPGFVDDDGDVFEKDIEALAAAGVTKGCNPPANDKFCPDSIVTREQMAAFLVRAFGLTDQGDVDFTDDDGSIFEADIEKLATAGITKGCNPPTNDRFCPSEPVTRAQMAAFLQRAFVNSADTATSPPKIDVEPTGIVIFPL